jgi:hypothetical protein
MDELPASRKLWPEPPCCRQCTSNAIISVVVNGTLFRGEAMDRSVAFALSRLVGHSADASGCGDAADARAFSRPL